MGIDLGNNTDSLQIIFWVFSAVEILGALLFLFGFDRWGIELLIAYLFFTGVILHHFWVKKLESSVMNTLAFTQIVTVLGLLLYVRENLLIQQQYSKSSQTVVIAAASMEDEEDEDDVDEEEEEEEDDEEEVTVVKKVIRKKKSMKKTSEQQAALERIRARIDTIDFGTIGTATHDERDDLQRIVGIGPFCEEKLHSLEIFTFRQIAAMTPEIEFNVNEAIEFFNGRIRRDDWIGKARQFVEEGGHD
jgi:predicted flap endonuclease-1-like 5' DNA nuclease